MVSVFARLASAAGQRPRVIAALAWLLAGSVACTGTEHAVFIPFDRSVALPPPPTDSPPPPQDSGPPADPRDAAAAQDEDAGRELDPDLDPDVTFDWNQTLPGQGTCHAGRYVGSFTCTVPADRDAALSAPYELSGQVVFTLGNSSEQQVLAITEGAVKDTFGLNTGELQGSLGCADKRFNAGTVGGVSWFPFNTFEAALFGSFDDQALVIEGSFEMINDVGEQCSGDFHVSAVP